MEIKHIVLMTSLALGIAPLAGYAEDNPAMVADSSYTQWTPSIDNIADTAAGISTKTPQYLYGIYAPIINTSGYYGTNNLSYTELDALLPLVQWQRGVFFTDLRGLKRTGAGAEGNVGVGYRGLTPDEKYLYGAYAFYDFKHSWNNNNFQQMTLGTEFKTQQWSTIVNGYLPIGVKGYREVNPNDYYFAPVANTSYQNLYFDVNQEKALAGFDAQEGYDIPGTKGLSTYVGGYYFTGQGVTTITGPEARIEYAIHKQDGSALWGVFDKIVVSTSYQYDKVRHSNVYAGVRFSFRLPGQADGLSSMQRKLTDYIRRDVDVMTTDEEFDQRLNKADGSAVNFIDVNNTAGLTNALADSNADVISAQGTFNNVTGLTIGPNKYVTGDDYSFDYYGHTYTVATSTSPGATFNSGGGSTVTMESGSTLRDITINGAANSAGVVIDGENVTLNGLTISGFTGTGAGTGEGTNAVAISADANASGQNVSFTGTNLTLSGNTTDVYVNAAAGQTASATINSGTLSNFTNYGVLAEASGNGSTNVTLGAVTVNASSVTVNDGGAIQLQNAADSDSAQFNLQLNGTTVTGNPVGRGVFANLTGDSQATIGLTSATLSNNELGMRVDAVDDAGFNLTINSSSLINNTAGSGRQGLFTKVTDGDAVIALNNSNFSGNSRTGAYAEVLGTGTLNLSANNSNFNNNGTVGDLRDGMYVFFSNTSSGSGTVNITDSIFNNNSRSGLLTELANGSTGTMTATINNSTFNNNQYGIQGYSSSNVANSINLTVNDSTLNNNTGATGFSSGIYLQTENAGTIVATINDSTMMGNERGIFVDSFDTGSGIVTVNGGSIYDNTVASVQAFTENGTGQVARVTLNQMDLLDSSTGDLVTQNGGQIINNN